MKFKIFSLYSTVRDYRGTRITLGVEVFPRNFKMRESKQNDFEELWNYSLKMGDLIK